MFKADDIYALIGVFYADPDDQDNDSCKVLYFLQGNILTNENVRVRYGIQLFTNKKSADIYVKGDIKRGFSVRSYLQPELNVFLFGFSRTEKLYLVDITK